MRFQCLGEFQMNRIIDIIQYLPPFMREYLQLKLITDAEDIELQAILEQLVKLNQNQYVLTADHDGLKRFESMLGLYSMPDESLETRRNKILAKWNDELPYTMKALRKQLDIVCGENNYDISTDFRNYQLEIIAHLKQYGEVDEFHHIIDYMMPCNILLSIINQLQNQIEMKLYVGGTVSIKSKIRTKGV